MYHLYHKDSTVPKISITSNESLSDLFHDFVTNHATHLKSPLQIELWKDSWSICNLSQLVQLKLGTHVLCLAFDLIEHERSHQYSHPEIPKDAIQYIDFYGMRYLTLYGARLCGFRPNKIEIQYPYKTEIIPIHDDLLCDLELTYVYRFTKYLIRGTEAPFDDPFIGVTNDIMPSVNYFVDKIHRDHSCLAMISTGHYTKTVYCGNKRLDYETYLEYCLDGQEWGPIGWNDLNCKRISDDMLLNEVVITRDGLYIKSNAFSLRFNIGKFLTDLEGIGTLTKKANK